MLDNIVFRSSERDRKRSRSRSNVREDRERNGDTEIKEDNDMDIDIQFRYFSWSSALKDFWNYFLMLLSRWHKPAQTVTRYTELFRAFSKIFSLIPESGDAYRESINIRGQYVDGNPELRFNKREYTGFKMFVVTEVKHYKAFKDVYNSENFTYENIQLDVLGQHGIKLLLEAKDGYFSPYVVGVLCIGTKIIFTFMYIELDSYNEIVDKGRTQNRVQISYTRPYDYMDFIDRRSLIEPLMWLGFVQSNGFKY